MGVPLYVVDAFAHKPFSGNPAGVAILDVEPDAEWAQAVAAEMKHAETAFVWPLAEEGTFGLRWFTPTVEVDLCGHATLASARVLFEWQAELHEARFNTKSGWLVCSRGTGDSVSMDFPSEAPELADAAPEPFAAALRIGTSQIQAVLLNRMDWFLVVDSEATVLALDPDMAAVGALGMRGVVVTASASTIKADFVSRFFAPQSGVPEDPVTGSAHCALAPYWTDGLGRNALVGYQASPRGGFVRVEQNDARVTLTGDARIVISGEWIA